jgi:hypothetical protein
MSADMRRLQDIGVGYLVFRGAMIVSRAATRVAHAVYHIAIIGVSAGIALLLPVIAGFLARNFLAYWALIQDEKVFIVSIEIAVAVVLILLLHAVGTIWRDRRFAKMARRAGMLSAASGGGLLRKRHVRSMKERRGVGRDLMLIGSTGIRTFVDPTGDLYGVLHGCREAKIMLLDPESEGAKARAKVIVNPEVTEDRLREQIGKSIDLLRQLKAAQKSIKLKLYQDAPFLKLAIVGDYLWMQHYHGGMDVQMMPEYVFQHGQNPGSLYVPLYQYFLDRWNDLRIPEYDFETDELVYRDAAGNAARREPFNRSQFEAAAAIRA